LVSTTGPGQSARRSWRTTIRRVPIVRRFTIRSAVARLPLRCRSVQLPEMCAGAPNIPLLILVGILWFWLWLRLMALRLHDINRSAKWLLVLWLLPAVLAAAGGGQQMITLGGGLFWIVALLLNVVPGSEGDNDYGPPPGPNTLLVKVGAALFIAFTALAVVANVKYMQYVR